MYVPVAGGGDVELGAGGGPLVVGLVLGVVSRTGPVTWQIPHGANLVLRQLGILMFLASAGLASGTTFADTIGTGRGAELAVTGAVVAIAFATLVPLAVQVILRRDATASAGMLAGIETQPAALAFAVRAHAGRRAGQRRLRPRVPGGDDRQDRRRAVPGVEEENETMTEATGPLAGVGVIDAATLFAGPLAATFLGDLGADVVKIEHPAATRRRPHPWPVSATASACGGRRSGRNKRTVTLDLSPAARAPTSCSRLAARTTC